MTRFAWTLLIAVAVIASGWLLLVAAGCGSGSTGVGA